MTTQTRRRFRRPKLADTSILKRTDLTQDLWTIWLEKPDGFSFKPGQYCTIGVDGIERAYSIVSAPYEKDLELFVELVPPPDGNLTPLLYNLRDGDSVTIRPRAKGIFVFDPSLPNQLFVATVTGVVPYISIIRQYLNDGQTGHHFYILMGASYHDEFGYDAELEKLAADHPEMITFVPTISRPDEEPNSGWNGETGRVNAIVEEYAEKWDLTPQDTIVYACGHPGMIEDVKDRMIPQGIRGKRRTILERRRLDTEPKGTITRAGSLSRPLWFLELTEPFHLLIPCMYA